MAQNDSFDILEKWRGGVEFCFAWHQFADPYALEKYRNTTSREALEAEQIMMVAELWAGLRGGQFEAFGKCLKPEISNGPVLIPVDTFEYQPPCGIGNSNDFEISGWRYEGVKVVPVREIDTDVDADATLDVDLNPQPTTCVAYRDAVEPIAPVARKRGGGRPQKRNGGYRAGKAAQPLPPHLRSFRLMLRSVDGPHRNCARRSDWRSDIRLYIGNRIGCEVFQL